MKITSYTNIASNLVQKNLEKSSNALNTAIERMTTGFKINHASDNAAGYSIAQNLSGKLTSYDVASDNISAGLDLLSTAQDTISLMQAKGERLMSLWTQAQNGTYGATSLSAINSEAAALVQEINRLYMNAEYNGIDIFAGMKLPDWAEEVKNNAGIEEGETVGLTSSLIASYNGFIADPVTYNDYQISQMESISNVGGSSGVGGPSGAGGASGASGASGVGGSSITSGHIYAISTKADLENLAFLVNSGVDTTNVTFVLAGDIDISGEQWTPIGTDYSHSFKGTFDGNGHKITGLTITPEEGNERDNQGLFGYTSSTSIVKNVGVEGVNVRGNNYTGGLAGVAVGSIINSYATGSVTGTGFDTGGLVGSVYGTVTNSYATGNVTGTRYTGGLVGKAYTNSTISNSYATGAVTGQSNTGGLVGSAQGSVTNSYASGSVTGTEMYTGGLVGYASSTVTNSYATGNVTGTDYTGGLVGRAWGTVTNSYASGSVTGTEMYTGGLVGLASGTVTNSYAMGNVTGESYTGGLVGSTLGTVTNSYATGNVTGTEQTGGLAGYADGDVSTVAYNKTANPELNAVGYGLATNVTELIAPMTTLQVGINGDSSSQITFNSGLDINLNINDISQTSAYNTIKDFLDQLSNKATELGAVSNRLESALESTMVSIENITSSLSTIRDADIATVSSDYIKMQILQQASATLLATANQSPAIALQLI